MATNRVPIAREANTPAIQAIVSPPSLPRYARHYDSIHRQFGKRVMRQTGWLGRPSA